MDWKEVAEVGKELGQDPAEVEVMWSRFLLRRRSKLD
jgi:hypothetical protein